MKKYHNVNGKLLAKEGKRDELLLILLEAASAMEKIDRCYCYLVGTSPQEDNAIYVYEVWEDESAHQESLGLELFQEMITRARPFIAGMEDAPPLVIHGGKAKALR